ncbi:MAG: VOC family protein [Armatimonadetes bacterium]|nr:VOC family protein [Armatimonadota bacterium]
MIGLVVKDLAASRAFYGELGCTFSEDDGPYIEAVLPGGMRLSLNAESMARELDPDWVKPVGQGIGLAFLCDSPEHVDAVFGRLVALGHSAKKEPWDAFWGQRYAQICDPDGYVVDVFAPLE